MLTFRNSLEALAFLNNEILKINSDIVYSFMIVN